MNYNTVIKLTNEQKNIINFIKDGNNLIIKARAGCAKTTTCLHSIKSIKRKKVLFLLFNKMLKIDLHNKINKMFKKDEKVNIVSNNYHSFVIDFYNQINGTYSDIINVCENNIYPTNNMDFDIIFIDEAQDLDLLLCTFLNKIINDIFNFKKIYPQLIFIGDDLQQIYGFKSSDCKYFLNANEYFNNNKNVWISSVLNTTFRFNIKHANYINNIYNKQIIKSNLITNFDVTSIKDTEENILINFVFNDIKNKINSGSFYDDFFVIAPSIKYRNSLIKKIENILVFNDIPCFHTLTDYDELNYEYIKNKIVFTTFHQTKGLERDYVYIILSNKEEKVENSLYVACTRMKKQLVIVNYIYSTNNKKDNNKNYIKLTEFIKNIHPTLEYIIYEKYIKRNINIINKYDKKDEILKNNIKLLFKSKNNIFIYENIENINNKAIMRWFEYNFFNKITFLDNFIKNQYLKNSSKEICNLYDIYNNKKDITLSFIYKLCLEEEYMNNGFIFRKKYINTDQYFSDNFLNKSILNNLKEKIGNSKYKFEYSLFDKTLKLIANFDVIDDENKKIYYIKISNNIINQKDIMQFYLNMIIIEFYHKRKETYQHIIFNPVTLEEIHLIFKKDLANIIHKKLLDELQYSDKINE